MPGDDTLIAHSQTLSWHLVLTEALPIQYKFQHIQGSCFHAKCEKVQTCGHNEQVVVMDTVVG